MIVEDCWSWVKEAICGASEEVLGFRTHAQPGWMTGRSLEKVSERKAIKDKINATKLERLKTRKAFDNIHKESLWRITMEFHLK